MKKKRRVSRSFFQLDFCQIFFHFSPKNRFLKSFFQIDFHRLIFQNRLRFSCILSPSLGLSAMASHSVQWPDICGFGMPKPHLQDVSEMLLRCLMSDPCLAWLARFACMACLDCSACLACSACLVCSTCLAWSACLVGRLVGCMVSPKGMVGWWV